MPEPVVLSPLSAQKAALTRRPGIVCLFSFLTKPSSLSRGTWETSKPLRANSERLAPPQVVADDFPPSSHNKESQEIGA
jgi:hypothetical protein